MYNPINPAIKIFVLSIVLLLAGCISLETKGSEAQDFSLKLYGPPGVYEDDEFTLSSSFGQPIILNFWFPSCPPCAREIPEINQFHEEYKNSVTVVGIQLIGIDTIESGRDFMKSKNVSYRVGPDNDGSITVDYSISGFPTTIFIDKLGHIHEKWEGEIKKSDMVEIAQELFEK